ncbi:MAG: glycoside hydrolase family 2 TIM barrel-domain containing protein [Rikenellaceae bacterium]
MKKINLLLLLCLVAFNLSAREVKSINKNWNFYRGVLSNPELALSGSAEWKSVDLPHIWGVEEAQKGNINYYRGEGWYRHNLQIEVKDNRRYFVKFGAASLVSTVYLNGKEIGHHRGGFAAFTYELTKHLKKSGDNILTVMVNNAKVDDVMPLAGDFNIYGGLYRGVELIETGDICFDMLDYGSSAVQWRPKSVTNKNATVELVAWVSNSTEAGLVKNWFPPKLGEIEQIGTHYLVGKIFDADNNVVSEKRERINLTSRHTLPYWIEMDVKKPTLWNGTQNPYLYRGVVELYSEDDKLLDVVEHEIGFKNVEIDPDNGFKLNGKPYRIHGVSMHQDIKDKGWATSKKDIENSVKMMLDMGVNAVRLSHYQHSDYIYELCDKNGILVFTEIPYVSARGKGFPAELNAKNQLLELIRQNYNHCSVFTWGLYNELGLSEGETEHSRLVWELHKLAKSEDPYRPTTGATTIVSRPTQSKMTDILCWNRYPAWYDPYEDYLDETMWDRYRYSSREGGFAFSEYGAGANIYQHEQNPKQPIPNGQWHPEEWQSKAHEAAWKSYTAKPYIWGSFVWNMFDFGSAKRDEGGTKGMNDKGLVTFDHKTTKDAYFFYKANWNPEPMIYLTSKRHTLRNEAITPIKVYCNSGGKVSLKINGVEIGQKKADEFAIVIFEDITLQKGDNKIEVSTISKGKTLSDSKVWIYDPNATAEDVNRASGTIVRGDGGFGY